VKRVVITGAASGIGAETVVQLLAKGCRGLVPEEGLKAVAARIVGASLGRPQRDVATTRSGTVSYLVLRRLPRRLIDRAVMASLRKQAAGGKLDASPLAGDLARELQKAG